MVKVSVLVRIYFSPLPSVLCIAVYNVFFPPIFNYQMLGGTILRCSQRHLVD